MARVRSAEVISGRLGGRVYRNLGGEAFVSAAPTRNDPNTAAQADARRRLVRATQRWAELPLDAMSRWRAYAEGAATLGGRARRADLVFRGLGAKFLQVHGGAAVPTEPPTSAFLGDGIAVSVSVGSPSPDGSFGRGGWGERREGPPPPSPLLQDEPLGGGGVLFTTSGPNSEGVLTELLLQPLAARHRKPHPREYRTRAFVAFAGDPVLVPCRPGTYAAAIRFVRAATGQETGLVPLGVVEVG